MIDDAAFRHHCRRGENLEILKLRKKKVEEDETHFQTIKFSKSRWNSWRRTNYHVVKKWTHHNVGRSFDDVYSELSKKPNGDLLKKAFRNQIDKIHDYEIGPDNTLIPPEPSYYEVIYLDADRILHKIEKKSRKSWRQPKTSETDYDWFKISTNRIALRSNKGIWFELLISNKMQEQTYTYKLWNEDHTAYELVKKAEIVTAKKQIYPCNKKFWVYHKVFKRDYYGHGYMQGWYPTELTQMSSKRKTQLGILN
jgi:hypothetical protein